MIKIDIRSNYIFYNNELENIELLDLNAIKIDENTYEIENDKNKLHISLNDTSVIVENFGELYYKKIYALNEKTLASMKFIDNTMINYIYTTKLEKNNNEINIIAKEYSSQNEILFDIKLTIEIRGEI